MNFDLEPEYRQIREQADRAAAAIDQIAVEADRSSEQHPALRAALRDSGLAKLVVPRRFGGRFEGVDPVAVCVVRQRLMATSTQLDSLFALQGIGSYALSVAGSATVQDQWLPGVASLNAIAALALTEDGAGSDAKALQTTVSADGDDLVISGEKSFISNAGACDFYTVIAREGAGYTAVVVPANSAGVSTTPSPEIVAPHVLGAVHFERVRVPADHRIGEPGDGFRHVLATLAVFRASVAAAAVGISEAALEEVTRHAATRTQFGRPLAAQGAVAQMLAVSLEELEASRLLTYRAAYAARDGADDSLNRSSLAKVAATEAASRITDRAVQIMGRWGVIKDSRIERLWRASRPMRIYEGATEVLRAGISKSLVAGVMER